MYTLCRMKFVANLILNFLFIPLFLAAVLASSFKFQLLKPDFWQNAFRTNNVYTNLALALKSTAEQETVKKGGSLREARVLTDLITPDNLQDFIERNIKNLLDFANGTVKDAVVYVPIKILPKGMLPASLGKITENTPLAVLLAEFHILGIREAEIELFSRTGQAVGYLLTLDAAGIALVLIGFFFLTDKGKRFTAPAIAFTSAGFLTLTASSLGYVVRRDMLNSWVEGSDPVRAILSSFLPCVLDGVLKVWIGFGAFAFAAGIMLLFFKRK